MSLGTLILGLLVVAAVLVAMGMLGTNPFASRSTFVVCVCIAVVVAGGVVGGFILLVGPPTISRSS